MKSLGKINQRKAEELIEEYNNLHVNDSLYTSVNLSRYLDSYFREHGLSYGDDFMCPPFREGEIVKLTDKKVVSSRKPIKSSFTEEDAVSKAFPRLSKESVDTIASWYRLEGAIDDFKNVSKFAQFISDDFMDMFWAGDYYDDEFVEVANDMVNTGYYEKDDFPCFDYEGEEEENSLTNSRKPIKSSPNFKEFTADEIFDTFNISQLTGTVFMDRDECKEARCGMGEFTDLMYDIVPTYLGVQTADDVREVCRRAKNPQAKAFLEAFETAMENAKFVDKFYDSIAIHKRRNNMIQSGKDTRPVDDHMVNELVLIADNTAELYEQVITPVVKNLNKKVQKGIYDENKALISWEHVVDETAKYWDKKNGTGKGSLQMLSKGTRKEAAKRLMERYSDDVFEGTEIKSSHQIKSSFNYYDGFEDDVNFWYGRYCEDVDTGVNDLDVGIVEYIAGKVEDDGHPTESPEEFDSLMRAVQEELKRQGYFKQPWQVNSSRQIKSAVDGGWEVDSSDVPKALDMWVEYVGEDNALEDIAQAMGDVTLKDNLDWIAQQWGIADEIEGGNVWDQYEQMREIMGVHKLFQNLTQAAGYDELAEDLAFIFRMNDFQEWDER